MKFCLRNKVQAARIELKTQHYFQECQTIEEYINHFGELVDWAHYLKGAPIILKFCQGLLPHMQDQVACMVAGQPSDEIPQQWYKTAILYDENCIINEVFTNLWCQEDSLETPESLQAPLSTKMSRSPSHVTQEHCEVAVGMPQLPTWNHFNVLPIEEASDANSPTPELVAPLQTPPLPFKKLQRHPKGRR